MPGPPQGAADQKVLKEQKEVLQLKEVQVLREQKELLLLKEIQVLREHEVTAAYPAGATGWRCWAHHKVLHIRW